MSWPPHLTVATVVQQHDKFLMVEEMIDGELVLNQPAGHLEPGETLFDAALRETLEETAWRVELTGIIGIYHYYAPAADITYHRIAFAASAIEHSGQALDADISAAHWLPFDEIRGRPLRSPLVIRTIEDYQTKTAVPLSFLHHQG